MTEPLPDLVVRQMHIIWRDTFVTEGPRKDFLAASRERLLNLPCYVSDSQAEPTSSQPELLRIIERVSRSAASIGHPDLLRFQFEPFYLTDLRPTLRRLRCPPESLTTAQVAGAAAEADLDETWISVTPILLLHRAGMGIMQYHVTLEAYPPDPGITPEEAIEIVRLGINPQLLSIPECWRLVLPAERARWGFDHVLVADPDLHLAICGLRDLSQVIAARLGAPLPKRKRQPEPLVKPPRPTGSTLVVLLETAPSPGIDLGAFAAEHAATLRGIGAMDSYYRERAPWLVERDMGSNIGPDRETAVYLLGNSELILFNEDIDRVSKMVQKRLHLSTQDLAATYLYMHYEVLLEWIYLQDAILRAYLQRLDTLIAAPTPRRVEMIDTLQGALSDLVQYREGITPFATRVEFLELAGAHHKLDDLAATFERKQELLLNYSSEYYDYREARASEFLNWLAAILAGGELANLIINAAGIAPNENVTLYLSVTLGSVALVFLVMIGLSLYRRR